MNHQAKDTPALRRLRALLRRNLRISVTDGRVFIGSFAGTDQPMNILLLNTEEYRIGAHENPNGRFVGQVLIPWRIVVKIEAEDNGDTDDVGFEDSSPSQDAYIL